MEVDIASNLARQSCLKQTFIAMQIVEKVSTGICFNFNVLYILTCVCRP